MTTGSDKIGSNVKSATRTLTRALVPTINRSTVEDGGGSSPWTRRHSLTVLLLLLILLEGGHCLGEEGGDGVDGIGAGGRRSDIKDLLSKEGEALEKLMQVFGVRPPHHRERHAFAPQYMLDLYNSIADSSGITKTSNPYGSNVIRSFSDKDFSHHMHFMFNISGVQPAEKILQAEFHVYKTKHSPRMTSSASQINHQPRMDDIKSHLLEMRVYQVMDESQKNKEGNNRLLDARRVSAYSIGWEVFHVKTAVADWLRNHSTNHGILITLRTMSGEPANDNLIRVAKRRHHGNKQPILVLFTDDGRPKQTPTFPTPDELAEWHRSSHEEFNSEEDYWENEVPASESSATSDARRQQRPHNATHRLPPTTTTSAIAQQRRRRRRSDNDERAPPEDAAVDSDDYNGASSSSSATDGDSPEDSSERAAASLAATSSERSWQHEPLAECGRSELYVDFEKIGWHQWIISPKGYNAFFCDGSCSFPLGQNQKPTNHATVQSIVHELHLHDGLRMPCCVPNKLFSIGLLYFEGNGNVVLKVYEDMVAASCGCH